MSDIDRAKIAECADRVDALARRFDAMMRRKDDDDPYEKKFRMTPVYEPSKWWRRATRRPLLT